MREVAQLARTVSRAPWSIPRNPEPPAREETVRRGQLEGPEDEPQLDHLGRIRRAE